MSYREDWLEHDQQEDEAQEETTVRVKYVQRWQCYADVDKSESPWTREQYTVKFIGGGNRGQLHTVDCSCGGDGEYDGGICIHRYRTEWLHRKNANDIDPDDPEEWEVTYDA